MADALIEHGVRVPGGLAYVGPQGGRTQRVGQLAFAHVLPEPYPFVLTLPQHETERVLLGGLQDAAGDVVAWGTDVTHVDQDAAGVTVQTCGPGGVEDTVRARLLLTCDGARGGLREQLGVPARGGAYGDTYAMMDVPDTTDLEDWAGIHLSGNGVVEAFPLPDGVRRWVVKTDAKLDNPQFDDVAKRVLTRTGFDLSGLEATFVSSFGVQRKAAARFGVQRVWWVGDAAHVIAPIGGQGMTLGWQGGMRAAEQALSVLRGLASPEAALQRYERPQRRAYRAAVARSAWNLRMGRTHGPGALKGVAVRLLLKRPLAGQMARAFTMQAP
jgi:2-polyprenyl-6-methoxyphenol hydroxylase-like FAD-dependent oxidoreductase